MRALGRDEAGRAPDVTEHLGGGSQTPRIMARAQPLLPRVARSNLTQYLSG
jgi:hypothetical protein